VADLAGFCAGTLNLINAAPFMPKKPFSHLASGRVACTQNKYSPHPVDLSFRKFIHCLNV
jgi:hypothetical protein